jgi:iron complex outermembrane receptor protein
MKKRALFGRSLGVTVAAVVFFAVGEVDAQDLEEVVVVATPIPSTIGLDPNKFASHVQQATAKQLAASNFLDMTSFINSTFSSVNINEAQNNPLQPDVRFRGYTASPLLGLPQGLAVYQNGARINEPLGDAVNWDLIPQSAINSISLISGANPVFGLNTLGGALAIQMKNGFNYQGHGGAVSGGSYDRLTVNGESGGNNDVFGYYINVHYFQEDGWRDDSVSDALNLWGSLSWRGENSTADAGFAYGKSDLRGNGPSPVGLLNVDREVVFTSPDITENDMQMVTLEGTHFFNPEIQLAGDFFYRQNDTDAFNGDASEFRACSYFGGNDALLEGLQEDDVEDLGIGLANVCGGTNPAIANVGDLENFLNALLPPGAEQFEIEDLTSDLSGTGILSDEAINNISARSQDSLGTNIQVTFLQDLFNRPNQFIAGIGYFDGDSDFNSVLELSELGGNRSTEGLGTGTFVDSEATDVSTTTESWSIFFTDTMEINDRLALTFSGRFNDTDVKIRDQSGERPELNGSHNFDRFNPAIGATYQLAPEHNLYAGYSESSRAPTPIELSCNDAIFAEAQRLEAIAGGDPADVDFECRLPNAFLADPPLDQVVAKSFEVGIRGVLALLDADYHLGFFNTNNQDDIIFQSTGRTTGLFANVDETRRRGVESSLRGQTQRFDWFLAYSWVDATFEDDFMVLSPNHPFANNDGEIMVSAGDTIPGVPEHQFKAGFDYRFGNGFSIGTELVSNSGQYIRGDESNQLDKTDGYAIVNLRASYRFNDRIQVFGRVNNLFDSNYETFGLLGEDPTEVIEDLTNDSPIFLGSGAPIGAWIGIKVTL